MASYQSTEVEEYLYKRELGNITWNMHTLRKNQLFIRYAHLTVHPEFVFAQPGDHNLE